VAANAAGFISGVSVWPGFVNGGEGLSQSPKPPNAESLVAKLPQPPEARGSGAGAPRDGRFLQFFNKNNALLCIFYLK